MGDHNPKMAYGRAPREELAKEPPTRQPRRFRVAMYVCLTLLASVLIACIGLFVFGGDACAICKYRRAVATRPIHVYTADADLPPRNDPPGGPYTYYARDLLWPTGKTLPVCEIDNSDEPFVGPFVGMKPGYIPRPLFWIAGALILLAIFFRVSV